MWAGGTRLLVARLATARGVAYGDLRLFFAAGSTPSMSLCLKHEQLLELRALVDGLIAATAIPPASDAAPVEGAGDEAADSTQESAELALQLEPVIAEQAKEKQRASGGAVVEKSTEPPIKTRVEVAKVAGVSENTIAKAKVIAEEADEPTKAALRRGQTTIHKEFKKIKEAKAEERGDAKPPKPKPLTQVQRLREIARVVKDMDEAFDEKDSDAALFASLRAKVNRLKELLKGVE